MDHLAVCFYLLNLCLELLAHSSDRRLAAGSVKRDLVIARGKGRKDGQKRVPTDIIPFPPPESSLPPFPQQSGTGIEIGDSLIISWLVSQKMHTGRIPKVGYPPHLHYNNPTAIFL